MTRTRMTLCILFFLVAGGTGLAPAGNRSAPEQQDARRDAASRNYFTDVELVNQDGQSMKFYSDLLRNHTVVIDTFFTSCTGVCPILSGRFVSIQEALGDRLGQDVYMISLSVDPVNDTPKKLKEYATQLNAQPGWFFLTGQEEDVETILKRLGQYVEDNANHNNTFIIGNLKTGLWKKAFGLAKIEEIIKMVDDVAKDGQD